MKVHHSPCSSLSSCVPALAAAVQEHADILSSGGNAFECIRNVCGSSLRLIFWIVTADDGYNNFPSY